MMIFIESTPTCSITAVQFVLVEFEPMFQHLLGTKSSDTIFHLVRNISKHSSSVCQSMVLGYASLDFNGLWWTHCLLLRKYCIVFEESKRKISINFCWWKGMCSWDVKSFTEYEAAEFSYSIPPPTTEYIVDDPLLLECHDPVDFVLFFHLRYEWKITCADSLGAYRRYGFSFSILAYVSHLWSDATSGKNPYIHIQIIKFEYKNIWNRQKDVYLLYVKFEIIWVWETKPIFFCVTRLTFSKSVPL